MLSTVHAIHSQQLNDQHDGTFTATILVPQGVTTTLSDNKTTRPAQVGDVYSIQDDGSVQGRVAGTTGPFERLTISGSSVVWKPRGSAGNAYIAPYVA